jgi:hypothetical protein
MIVCRELEVSHIVLLIGISLSLYSQLPVIGHFVALSLEQLNIKSISMYELERIVLMPQASKSLAALMTTLLRWVLVMH